MSAIAANPERKGIYTPYPSGVSTSELGAVRELYDAVSRYAGFHALTHQLFWENCPWNELPYDDGFWVYMVWLALRRREDIDQDNEEAVQALCRSALAEQVEQLLVYVVGAANWEEPSIRPTPQTVSAVLTAVVRGLKALVPFPGLVDDVVLRWRTERLESELQVVVPFEIERGIVPPQDVIEIRIAYDQVLKASLLDWELPEHPL